MNKNLQLQICLLWLPACGLPFDDKTKTANNESKIQIQQPNATCQMPNGKSKNSDNQQQILRFDTFSTFGVYNTVQYSI